MKLWYLVFLLFPLGLISQELPPIQTYSSTSYNGENQNWAISQSSNKFIYVANNHSLLEFNGSEWNKFGSPNGSVIRDVTVIDDKIYTGCYMEFGYWEKDDTGNLVYTSLLDKLDVPLLEDEEFWNITEIEDLILFQSLNRIYVYSNTDDQFRIIEAETDKAGTFYVDNNMYFQIKNKGIFRLTENEPELVISDDLIQNKTLLGMYSSPEGMVIITTDASFYRLKDNNLSPWQLNGNSIISSKTLYSFKLLKDNSIVLGTISDGLFQFSSSGDFIQSFDQQKGLNNNTILDIFQDDDSNLWLGHDNGISIINLNSKFRELIDKTGSLGVVYAATIFNEELYLGTNQGLFVYESDNEKAFKLIQGTEGQVWCLKIIDNQLFCGHHNGTYHIENKSASLISDFQGTWDIKPIKGLTNLLLQGNYNGLSVLQYSEGKWKFRNSIMGFDISSRFFEFSENKDLIVNHEYKGIFRLRPDKNFNSIEILSREEGKGSASSLVKFKDRILYATIHGVFSLSENKESFVVDTTLSNLFQYDNKNSLSILMNDGTDKGLFRFGEQDIIYLESSNFGNRINRTVVSIPAMLRNNLGVAGFENVTHIEDSRFLIGTSNGYIILDLNKIKQKDHEIYLNEIENYYYNKPSRSLALDSILTLENKENNLLFSFSIPEFDKYAIAEYQYKLEQYYDNWSDWSNTGEVTFENLPAGEYALTVKGRVGNTLTKNQIQYNFSIKKPWYWSNYAIAIYIILGIGCAILIHKIYNLYYRKQQKRIIIENKRELKRKKNKAKRQLVQLKNEKLKQEIESKNRELAVSTMSIIKKNEFLNSIKDRLSTLENNHQVKSVIKMIDRNISNEEDWKFFEEAFNNADKDFLRKMKSNYPTLTPNDLKLCAYLRLNLSSKEIAPLLNISTRSVEIKRYRLRKKMNLVKGSSLVDHILSI